MIKLSERVSLLKDILVQVNGSLGNTKYKLVSKVFEQ